MKDGHSKKWHYPAATFKQHGTRQPHAMQKHAMRLAKSVHTKLPVCMCRPERTYGAPPLWVHLSGHVYCITVHNVLVGWRNSEDEAGGGLRTGGAVRKLRNAGIQWGER
jgi:hypothetical protein